MRRALAFGFVALVASSFIGVAHADPGGDCYDPVDAFCTTSDTYTYCDVYVNAGTPADDCYTVR
ncbi:MAG: hypothetical protein ACYDCC_02425 [Actinomycetota bacterium]